MYLFTIALVALISHGSCYYSKCCKSQQHLEEVNSTYNCIENKSKRSYVLTNDSNFLSTSTSGECADVSSDFFIFDVSQGRILGKRPLDEMIFPKCCPLNYSYNSILHACEESDEDIDFIQGDFIRVGLPGCKIIVDSLLEELTDVNRKLRQSISSSSYCIDRNERESFVYRECKENLDACESIKCVKKCCPDGQSFINGSRCFDTYTRGLNLSTIPNVYKAEEPFAIISNRVCPSIYILKEDYTFHLDEKGLFEFWHIKSKSFLPFKVNDMNSYCIEHAKTPKIDRYLFFMCYLDDPPVKKFEYTVWPKILSCIFLVLTVLVYIILNETRNVFGKLLVNYCAAMFCNEAILTYTQLSCNPSHYGCLLRGIGLIFFISASFSWSNVICYDIYLTFGSMQQNTGQLRNHLKKLLVYMVYGWTVPTVVTLIVISFYYYRVLPYSIQPFLAEKKCFFDRMEGNYSQDLFLNLPLLIIQLVNSFFFIKTAIYCLKVKNEINKIKDTTFDERNKRYQKDKERLFIILKLSIIMGISFIFEAVSSFFVMNEMGPTAMYIEIVFDFINCLQGVFIFIIFICKRKICHDLLRKFRTSGNRDMSFSSLSTQTTATSSRTSKKSNRS